MMKDAKKHDGSEFQDLVFRVLDIDDAVPLVV